MTQSPTTVKPNNDYFHLSPLILLLWGVFSIFVLPVIPIASGFGWDGVLYGKMALNFQNMIGSFDSYHAGRIFPSVLLHYLFVWFKIPFELKNILFSFQLYYLVVLTVSAILWVKITGKISLKPIAKWVGFVALFINYPILNWYFYYPPLTDGTAFLLGMLMLYAYLTKGQMLLIATIIISFFTWPTGIVIGLFIFIYFDFENKFWITGQVKLQNQILWVSLIVLPLVVLVLSLAAIDSLVPSTIVYPLHGQFLRSFGDGILISIYFIWIYWLILKKFDFKAFIKENFKIKTIVKILLSLFIVVILSYTKGLLCNPNYHTVSIASYANDVVTYSTRFPLQFIFCHVSFWGPMILLLIIFFKNFTGFLTKFNFALMLGFLFTIIFSINGESRAITNFYPIIVFILIQCVDFHNFKRPRLFLALFVVASVLYSKIWLIIKLPSSAFPYSINKGLGDFPMQWYFMNVGLVINPKMFALHALVTMIFLAAFYFLTRPKAATI